jgi:hypothetical protein
VGWAFCVAVGLDSQHGNSATFLEQGAQLIVVRL